jgi:hypothetical protein
MALGQSEHGMLELTPLRLVTTFPGSLLSSSGRSQQQTRAYTVDVKAASFLQRLAALGRQLASATRGLLCCISCRHAPLLWLLLPQAGWYGAVLKALSGICVQLSKQGTG